MHRNTADAEATKESSPNVHERKEQQGLPQVGVCWSPQALLGPQRDCDARQLDGQQRRVSQRQDGGAAKRQQELFLWAALGQPVWLQHAPQGWRAVFQQSMGGWEEV
jgi:hypothetical protein